MKRWIAVFFAVFSLAAGSVPLFAQLASDPSDRMYTDLQLWEERGIIPRLPQLRPYPIQLLKELLSEVQQKGDDQDAARAREYYADMDGAIHIHPGTGLELRSDTTSVYGQYIFGGPFQGSIDPIISYSGYLQGIVNNAAGDSMLPEYVRSPVDYLTDNAVRSIGGFTPRVSSATSAAIGTDTWYIQAGNTRGSWGPFWGENAVLSPSTPQAAQIAYVFRAERLTVTEAFFELGAGNSSGSGWPQPGKFMALHGLDLYALPWLTVGMFESIVWGPRFEPLYLLPFSVYYINEGLVGFPDNSFIGVNATVRLPEALQFDFVAYFDDMYFSNLIMLDFNTKMKFAAQAGLTWTPNLPLLSHLALNVLMVTPYTYSHEDTSGSTNYLDYTTDGTNIGPSLQPDSLRVEIDALMRPVPQVDIQPFARMILHGNASSNAPFPDPGDGTIFDNGYVGNNEAFNTFRFLDQAVIEKTVQVGADAAAYFHLSFGTVKVYGSYTFEYITDKGLSAGATALNNYFRVGFFYQY